MGKIYIWTDGACEPNPGNGAWAYVIEDNHQQLTSSGSERGTTNNRMEYLACIKAIESTEPGRPIVLHTDSQLIVMTMTKWLAKWKAKPKMLEKKKNLDLVLYLDELCQQRSVEFIWVPGHSGIPNNELADHLCNEEIKKMQLSQSISSRYR